LAKKKTAVSPKNFSMADICNPKKILTVRGICKKTTKNSQKEDLLGMVERAASRGFL